ncbi:MAG: FG-GAP-like repeat-containing protein [Balneolaceae bacterium]
MMQCNGLYSALCCLLILMAAGCRSGNVPPEPGSEAFAKLVSDAHIADVATHTDQLPFGMQKMESLTEQAPREASFWANLALQRMRFGALDQAREAVEKALELEPDEPVLLFNAGEIESRYGNLEAAEQSYRRAAEGAPERLLFLMTWVLEADRLEDPGLREQQIETLEKAHRIAPGNLVVLFERLRFSVREEDPDAARIWLNRLATTIENPDAELSRQLDQIAGVLETGISRQLVLELSYLRHTLEMHSGFQRNLDQVRRPPGEPGLWVQHWFWLPAPQPWAAPADTTLRFQDEPVQPDETVRVIPEQTQWIGVWTLLDDRPPLPVWVVDNEIVIDDENRISLPETVDNNLLHSRQLATLDMNQNFRNDLIFASESGVYLYRHEEDGSFSNVSQSHLPEQVRHRSWDRVWVIDLDQDGDLDLILSSPGQSQLLISDGERFQESDRLPITDPMRQVIVTDLSSDGAADLLVVDGSGTLRLFVNERQGVYRESGLPESEEEIVDVAVEDLNGDGMLDLLGLEADGTVVRIHRSLYDQPWMREIWLEGERSVCFPDCREGTLMLGDLDLNGNLDLVLSASSRTDVWLSEDGGALRRVEPSIPGGAMDLADLDGDNRLDVVGRSGEEGTWVRYSLGKAGYSGETIRVRASGTEGDRRINSFGLGGELEVRSGELYVKRRIDRSNLHVGLGTRSEAEMIRIIWPNGSVQAEFSELGMGNTIMNEQLLKGSCPWLFAHDGTEFGFVTDAIWRSPLGLRINAQETLGEVQTFDRVRVSSGQLAPVDGRYHLRMTAELWETHYFDHMQLRAVDHPEGTTVFVDERFVFPAPDLTPRLLTTPEPVAAVLDSEGRDQLDRVQERDGRYLQAFDKSAYQGLVHPHTIEIELTPRTENTLLILSGWLRPTDSSINLALGQGNREAPSGLRVDVSEGESDWRVLHEDFGVPAGKEKSILLDLSDAFESTEGRRVRLSTTSEIYWDAIRQAESLNPGNMKVHVPNALRQELQFRGYSTVSRAGEQSPALPDYTSLSGTSARWFDLEGFYTRFGDVRELLERVDDRYVIMNAGDELVLEYEALPDPEPGMIRTFLFDSDGWVKDGDVNTEGSATVGPLPYHEMAETDHQRDAHLLDDPVYRRFQEDWSRYHTRYVTPLSNHSVLRTVNPERRGS